MPASHAVSGYEPPGPAHRRPGRRARAPAMALGNPAPRHRRPGAGRPSAATCRRRKARHRYARPRQAGPQQTHRTAATVQRSGDFPLGTHDDQAVQAPHRPPPRPGHAATRGATRPASHRPATGRPGPAGAGSIRRHCCVRREIRSARRVASRHQAIRHRVRDSRWEWWLQQGSQRIAAPDIASGQHIRQSDRQRQGVHDSLEPAPRISPTATPRWRIRLRRGAR